MDKITTSGFIDSDKILALARETVLLEIRALEGLKGSLDESFVQALKLIGSSSGRVVITGIGKSALIGKKIVATLNSTGTSAVFMHAADAVHGDIGIVQSDDTVVCISKSGNTAELKALIPLVKKIGNKLIAIVSNTNSDLARHADVSLYIPIEKEADPNNLAPTASSVAQMALGDALAICLLSLRGFESRDFALLHPGGALGKQLYLKVSDIYTVNEKPQVSHDAPLKDVIIEISTKRLGATAVLGENRTLIGIITDGDLRRMLERNTDFMSLQAHDIMTTPPKTINANELAVKALNQMEENSITQLLVVENNRYLGVVHIHDLLREGLV